MSQIYLAGSRIRQEWLLIDEVSICKQITAHAERRAERAGSQREAYSFTPPAVSPATR